MGWKMGKVKRAIVEGGGDLNVKIVIKMVEP